jgi:FMN-dependent NADH-azoreductase
MEALALAPAGRSPDQSALVADGDLLIDEVRQAQTLVIGLPLYNFGIPSTLKAWFDHISRAGETFYYGENGPVGMLGGRKVIGLSTRGDRINGSGNDPQTDHVREILNFLGIEDIQIIHADGLTIDEPSRSAGMASALDRIMSLATEQSDLS